MSRSLFGKLHRRFGARPAGAERVRRSQDNRRQLEQALLARLERAPKTNARVVVVGAGFAGLAAAHFLAGKVGSLIVLEASGRVGGRVLSNSTVVPGRIAELGAELIGLNHPLWLALARKLGIGLSVLTSEDYYAAEHLEMPLSLLGRRLSPAEAEALYRDMKGILDQITTEASKLTSAERPWEGPDQTYLDQTSFGKALEGWVDKTRQPLLWEAFRAQMANDNVADLYQQSYLGLLALVKGGSLPGDPGAYWTESEAVRSENGNQNLAEKLAVGLDVRLGTPVARLELGGATPQVVTRDGKALPADHVVLATPPTSWPRLGIPYSIQTGPAIKCMRPLDDRFWIRDGAAPSALSSDLGMVWETTDNQMRSNPVSLSLFAGGPYADAAIQHKGYPTTEAWFQARISALYRGYEQHVQGPAYFANWPGTEWIWTGYSCPAPGQVTGVAKDLYENKLAPGRLFFAGEHTFMSYFGYMEGALQSGARAAREILALHGG